MTHPPRPIRAAAIALAALALAACANAPRTSLETSWADPQARGARFGKVLILTVASDEFAQQYFQQDLAAELKKRGVNAQASGRYFTHRSPTEEARFKRAVEQSGADAVILARVVGVEKDSTSRPGMLTDQRGVPMADAVGLYGAYAQAFAPTYFVAGGEMVRRTVFVETILYELKDRKAVWSARTETANADQGDLKPLVAQIVGVVVGAMDRDKVF